MFIRLSAKGWILGGRIWGWLNLSVSKLRVQMLLLAPAAPPESQGLKLHCHFDKNRGMFLPQVLPSHFPMCVPPLTLCSAFFFWLTSQRCQYPRKASPSKFNVTPQISV